MIIIIDTKEQYPYEFKGYKTITKHLVTGDYSIHGFENTGIIIERKSAGDFLLCCGKERDRFMNELDRMAPFERKFLVIESKFSYLANGDYGFTRIYASSVLGTVAKIATQYNIHPLFVDNHKMGEILVTYLFKQYYEKFREGKI